MTKKESILLAALELLAQNGVHNTPMSAIAKAAGTGMGTIYNYFPNKEILINELYVSIKEKEAAIFQSFDMSKPIKTQFEAYLSSIIQFFIANPPYFHFMEQVQASPIITRHSKEKGSDSIACVVQLLEKGQQERILKEIEMSELLMFIGGAVLSYLRWHFNQNKKHKISLQNQQTLVWDAIKA